MSACGEGNKYVAPPPPKVTVAIADAAAVTRYLEATGNTASVNTTDLVARVAGFIQAINYQDGAKVKKGTLLFTIEPEPYKVKLEQAKAAQVGAEATLKSAQATFQRQAELLSRDRRRPRRTTTSALAARDSAQATSIRPRPTRGSRRSTTTTRRSPRRSTASSRRGRSRSANMSAAPPTPTVLATIVQHDPIYVNFNISEQDVLLIRAEIARRGLTPEDLKKVPIEVGLQTETGYPHKRHARLRRADRQPVDRHPCRRAPSCRTPIGCCSPAISCACAFRSDRSRTRCSCRTTALGSDQGGRYVLIVNKDNVVEQRKVEIGPLVDTMRVIEKRH